jgi:hypothetical protein
MLPPLRSGVAEVTLSADHELLNPPPNACTGGPSSVVPWTETLQGVPPEHTVGSLIETTLLFADSARRSAAQMPKGSTLQPAPMDGRVVISTTRKRSLVIGCPTLFVIRRLKVRVPKVLFCRFPGITLRTRFGATSSGTLESKRETTIPGASVPVIGPDKFSGPGVLNLRLVPKSLAPTSPYKKSSALLSVSCG